MATLYVLFGKTTSGKDTVLQLLEQSPLGLQLQRAVRTTSRPIREGEVDGYDYHFINYVPLADNKTYLEENVFNGNWFYGTKASDVMKLLETGDVVITGSYHSMEQIIRRFPAFTSQHRVELIYLRVSKATQIERIKLRGTEHYEEGMRRITADQVDYPSFLSESPTYNREDAKTFSILNGYALYTVDSDKSIEHVLDQVSHIIGKKGAQPK